MKKVCLVLMVILMFPVLSFAGTILGSAALTASGGTATSQAFSIDKDSKEAGIIAIITGSTSTRLQLLGCHDSGDRDCISDNITILNYNTDTNAETGTLTFNHHIGDNATTATAATTANTVTNSRSRASIYLSDNMSSVGGTGSDGKFFFRVPIENFPPAVEYKIKATNVSATAGAITLEVNFR